MLDFLINLAVGVFEFLMRIAADRGMFGSAAEAT
jgi:hypothetical protein